MNNIRKIIEERLENAKYDYECHKHINLKDSPIMVSLESEIQAYQDCLNLLPTPRTEQETLKDFEKLGWKITTNDYYGFIFKNKRNELLKIYNISKTYYCECNLTMQEHKLLNELFECYSWL